MLLWQAVVPHSFGITPVERNVVICVSSMRVAAAEAVRIVAVRRAVRREVRGGRRRRAVVPQHEAGRAGLRLVQLRESPLRRHRHVRPRRRAEERRVERGLVVVRADRSRQHLGRDVRHLMVAVVLDDEDLLGRDAGVRVRR